MPGSPKKLRKLAGAEQNGHVAANGPHFEQGGEQKKRLPIFEYPELPKFEMLFYFLAVTGVILYSWFRIYEVSTTYQWGRTGWGRHSISTLPFFGQRKRDSTNYEWEAMTPLLSKLLRAFAVHCLIFNFSDLIFGAKSRHITEFLTLAYSVVATCWIFTPKVVLFSAVHGIFIFTVCRLIKRKPAVWGAAVPMLWLTLHNPFEKDMADLSDHFKTFNDLVFLSYKLLSYISYNLEFIDGRTRRKDSNFLRAVYRMFFYAFYLPYLISLIVLYPSFEKQMTERDKRSRDWKEIAFFAARIGFWYCFIELVLHFFYFEAVLADYAKLYAVRKDALTAIGYATGTFFYLKYVVIFGLPSLFAKLDKMQPLDRPICINRVALYSKVWRGFDRGLYLFFKEYIFLPICQPTFSPPRKIFGVLISYAFVLLWHGVTHQYVVWIVLNIAEIFQEQIAKNIYLIPAVKSFREANISDRNFRRILAWLQVLPFAFALYSNFYFLAGSHAGWAFVDRVFWQETVTMKWPAFLLVSMGYCYMHVCMEVERIQAEREKRKAVEKSKNV